MMLGLGSVFCRKIPFAHRVGNERTEGHHLKKRRICSTKRHSIPQVSFSWDLFSIVLQYKWEPDQRYACLSSCCKKTSSNDRCRHSLGATLTLNCILGDMWLALLCVDHLLYDTVLNLVFGYKNIIGAAPKFVFFRPTSMEILWNNHQAPRWLTILPDQTQTLDCMTDIALEVGRDLKIFSAYLLSAIMLEKRIPI